MLAVAKHAGPREGFGIVLATGRSRPEQRHTVREVRVVFGVALAQSPRLALHHGHIDQHEQKPNDDNEHQPSGCECEAQAGEKTPEIEWVACPPVGPTSSESLVLIEVAGGPHSEGLTEKRHENPYAIKKVRRSGQVERREPHRPAYRNAPPSQHSSWNHGAKSITVRIWIQATRLVLYTHIILLNLLFICSFLVDKPNLALYSGEVMRIETGSKRKASFTKTGEKQ